MRNTKATVYPTLWRPVTIKGVPRDYGLFAILASGFSVMICIGVTSIFWKNAQILGFLFAGLIFIALWTVGYYLGRRDPEFLTVYIARAVKVGWTKGEGRGNEYSA